MGTVPMLGLVGGLTIATVWFLKAKARQNAARAASVERTKKEARASSRALEISLRNRR